MCPAGSMKPKQCTSPWHTIEPGQRCVYSQQFKIVIGVVSIGKLSQTIQENSIFTTFPTSFLFPDVFVAGGGGVCEIGTPRK